MKGDNELEFLFRFNTGNLPLVFVFLDKFIS
jgi:hypothetical protein